MITKLVNGDTVLVKHPIFTDGKWEKGQILKSNDHYEIRLFNSRKILFIINKTDIVYDVSIIKVDPYFKIGCSNCKHCDKLGCDEPCHKCILGPKNSRWEPCDSLKNKDKLNGNDIKTFSIDEGPFTDKKVNYSYISTSRSKTVNMLERQMHEQLLAKPFKIVNLDMESMYPDLKGGYKLDYSKNIPYHSDNIDALRYSINDARVFAEFMADFNKKENKNMKKQQKRRNRNILVVKELNTAIEFDEIKFNGPATIIKWKPTFDQLVNDKKGDKTVTVAKEPDRFDKTTGFLLAVLKEVLDNKSYGNILEKIDEIKEFDELSKQTAEADLNNKTGLHHCSIKDLKEATEALENVYIPGSVVKYKYGKKNYMVISYRFDEQLKEMVYILRPYKGAWYSDLEDTRRKNVPHSKLIMVRRK